MDLEENEYEELIRNDKDQILNEIGPQKLKALMVVINKADFIENYDFSENEYKILES